MKLPWEKKNIVCGKSKAPWQTHPMIWLHFGSPKTGKLVTRSSTIKRGHLYNWHTSALKNGKESWGSQAWNQPPTGKRPGLPGRLETRSGFITSVLGICSFTWLGSPFISLHFWFKRRWNQPFQPLWWRPFPVHLPCMARRQNWWCSWPGEALGSPWLLGKRRRFSDFSVNLLALNVRKGGWSTIKLFPQEPRFP